MGSLRLIGLTGGALLMAAGCVVRALALTTQPPAFSAGSLVGWKPKLFSGRAPTRYQITRDGHEHVLHAVCQNSSSGLIWAHRIDLRQTPILSWRWKIGRIYPGLDPHQKAGDDYPARVYVVAGNPLLPWTLRSLVYVWANGKVQATVHGPRGTPFYPDPYTGQAEIVALEHGNGKVGAWVSEQRNVAADLARAFGGHRQVIGAVAVMSDCDDSHTHGQAWYGDIDFKPDNTLSK